MKSSPLANILRPQKLEDIVGQEILKKGSLLERMIRSKRIASCILYGPPASGKTSLVEVLKNFLPNPMYFLNATYSKVSDIREIIDKTKELENINQNILVVIDEIHRFSKSQQDVLLPYVEDGTIAIIGITTENPYFYVNKALLSRCLIFEFNKLKPEDILQVLKKAKKYEEENKNIKLKISEEDLELISKYSTEDIRFALNVFDILVNTKYIEAIEKAENDKEKEITIKINTKEITQALKDRRVAINKESSEHYDTISAFIKSIRGSDENASIYYLARMLENGEDPVFIARRLIISAAEDIGLANPVALSIANQAYIAVERIGMPEARIILAEATIYMARSKKSNTAYNAINKALSDMNKYCNLDIPIHIRNNPPVGKYKYPHDFPNSYVYQQYLPDEIADIIYYDDKESKDLNENIINKNNQNN